MEAYKKEFIEFMVRAGVLSFGTFTTKSGRETPFFINTGRYSRGRDIARLGQYYARAVHEALGRDFDCLFGPAYKGIPLVTATVAALATGFSHDVAYCFNRKEAKDHGEQGLLIGHAPRDGERIVIVEDVTTAGTSVRESVALLKSLARVEVKALVVSVDRMERGTGAASALAELREEFGLETVAIITLDEIVNYLYKRPVAGQVLIDDEVKARIDAYRARYGAAE
ncbi:MAG: orotate phosphoribosyltransferase [Planctomycetota bacterium]